MAQFYTLDEAAQRLGIPQDDFKRRLKLEWTSVRPFRDGATLRFRAATVQTIHRAVPPDAGGACPNRQFPLAPLVRSSARCQLGWQ